MVTGAWWATVHGIARVGHDLVLSFFLFWLCKPIIQGNRALVKKHFLLPPTPPTKTAGQSCRWGAVWYLDRRWEGRDTALVLLLPGWLEGDQRHCPSPV